MPVEETVVEYEKKIGSGTGVESGILKK